MEYIFQILCGMLYVFGLLFGWNYQETSVYVCIYAFPFLMLVPFVLTSARAFYIFLRGQRKTSTVLLLLLAVAAMGKLRDAEYMDIRLRSVAFFHFLGTGEYGTDAGKEE